MKESPDHSVDHSLKNLRVTVMGLGHFGGGVGVTRWLCSNGVRVVVTDQAPAEKLQDSLELIRNLPVELRLGGHLESDFTGCDLVVTSPAVKPDNPFLLAARNAGVPVTTEIALFVRRCPARVLGVTGTKGKSTTSSLLYQILHDQFPTTRLGGNIGGSLLDQLPDIRPEDLVVLELSSFMLYWLGFDQWSPHVGVLTMLGADHLDWHGRLADYHAAKGNLFLHQKPDDVAVVNFADDVCVRLAELSKARRVDFAADAPDIRLQLFGDHNRANARAAIAAAMAVGADRVKACESIARFQGLPHRLQLVNHDNGVRWVNDSIATNPAAVTVALRAFAGDRLFVIVGGRTKGIDDSAVIELLAKHASRVLTIGEVGASVAQRINAINPIAQDCQTLATAVEIARELAQEGDVVLLSPGYTSYDQFANFEERGNTFAQLARNNSQ